MPLLPSAQTNLTISNTNTIDPETHTINIALKNRWNIYQYITIINQYFIYQYHLHWFLNKFMNSFRSSWSSLFSSIVSNSWFHWSYCSAFNYNAFTNSFLLIDPLPSFNIQSNIRNQRSKISTIFCNYWWTSHNP